MFYTTKLGIKGGLIIEHRVQNVRKKIHNYRIETVFSKIKGRVHSFKGLKALWYAPIILRGLIIQPNFIEEPATTQKQHCINAGQDLDLGENRGPGLIKIASQVENDKL